jgi:hypothetical protein
MLSRKFISLAMALTLSIVGTAALAHHGRAAYSTDTITLQATVTEFRFINPHVQLYFDITTAEGELQHWQGELTAPNRLARGGWTKTTFKPGDEIRISGITARNGGNSVLIQEIILPDGQSIPLREVFD